MAVILNVIGRCIIEAICVTIVSPFGQVTICCLKFCYDLDDAQDSAFLQIIKNEALALLLLKELFLHYFFL